MHLAQGALASFVQMSCCLFLPRALELSAQNLHLLFLERSEAPRLDVRSYVTHQLIVKVKVVVHAQTHPQQLPRLEKMPDVRSGKGLAHLALAILVDGASVSEVLVVVKVDQAL